MDGEGKLTEYVDKPAGNAFQLGYNMRLEDCNKDTSPFPAGTKEYRNWLAGWYSADTVVIN